MGRAGWSGVDREGDGAAVRVAYIGNFDPSFTTENHVATAWEYHGHEVVRCQEQSHERWLYVTDHLSEFDLVIWTKTGWAQPVNPIVQVEMLDQAKRAGVPVIGYHLDRWWGLNRQPDVASHPFFRVDLLVTADGGHEEQWAAAAVEHFWLPPGVSRADARRPPEPRPEFDIDVAFVGSYRSYHEEWGYRADLVAWLQDTYGARFRAWDTGVREGALNALYQTAKVIVGDSCLAGGATHYWSDRIPETLGRGGFLIHPWVEGMEGQFTPEVDFCTYELGDFAGLRKEIDASIGDPTLRGLVVAEGREQVMAHHTYEVRVPQLLTEMHRRGMI